MNGTQDLIWLSKSLSECLKTTHKFGETIYTNICDGTVSHIAWGGVDWFWAMMGMGAVIFIVLIIALFILG